MYAARPPSRRAHRALACSPRFPSPASLMSAVSVACDPTAPLCRPRRFVCVFARGAHCAAAALCCAVLSRAVQHGHSHGGTHSDTTARISTQLRQRSAAGQRRTDGGRSRATLPIRSDPLCAARPKHDATAAGRAQPPSDPLRVDPSLSPLDGRDGTNSAEGRCSAAQCSAARNRHAGASTDRIAASGDRQSHETGNEQGSGEMVRADGASTSAKRVNERMRQANHIPFGRFTRPSALLLSRRFRSRLLLLLSLSVVVYTAVAGQECHGHGQPKTQDHGHAHSGGDHGSAREQAHSRQPSERRKLTRAHSALVSSLRCLCRSHSHAHAAPMAAHAAHGHSHGGAPCHGHGGAPLTAQPTVAIASASDVCQSCKKGGSAVTLSRCSRCKAAWYCSRECQTADWKEHKKSCNA